MLMPTAGNFGIQVFVILSLNFLNRIDLFTLITAGNILVSRSLKVRISGVYVPFILILPTCCYFLSIIFELSFELNLKQRCSQKNL